MIEILQIVLLQHSLPGCLALNAASLMMQPSLLLARLLERYMAGSPLMGPVGQQIDDNPVIRAYAPSTASPIQEIGRSTQLRSQCLAGVFSELGLNGASVENLTCHSLWKNERRVKGHHGAIQLDRANQRLFEGRKRSIFLQVCWVFLCSLQPFCPHFFSRDAIRLLNGKP